MKKQKFNIGDNVVLRGNPFDEQIKEEMEKYYDLRTKDQEVTDIKEVPHGFWIKTDLMDEWTDQYWFRTSDTH